jgi:hypothetical protein|eukprot:COSAG06_NODE_44982_length_358_cov_1.586873_1_plen_82_part_00
MCLFTSSLQPFVSELEVLLCDGPVAVIKQTDDSLEQVQIGTAQSQSSRGISARRRLRTQASLSYHSVWKTPWLCHSILAND